MKGSFQIGTANIVNISLDPDHIRACDASAIPFFLVPLDFTFHPPSTLGLGNNDVVYTLLTGRLSLGSVPDRGESVLTAIEPTQINKFYSHRWPQAHSHTHQIRIPCSFAILDTVEECRKADVNLVLDLDLGIFIYGESHSSTGYKPTDPPRIAEASTCHCRLNFVVPHSVWINNVLNNTKYGSLKLVEFPSVDRSINPDVAASYEALDRAMKYFKQGDYDKAVGDCRIALEPFYRVFKTRRKEETGELKRTDSVEEWALSLGEATITWLTEVLKTSWDVMQKPHHSHKSGYYSRLDAQMLMATTTAVISYVARKTVQQMNEKENQ